MKLKLIKRTLVDFRYMYDEFDCGNEELWYEKGECFSGKVISDNNTNISIKLDEDMGLDGGKVIENLPKDSFEILGN